MDQIRNGHPALNVKIHGRFGPTTAAIMEKFGCDGATADKALEYAFESARDQFWSYWRDAIRECSDGCGQSPAAACELRYYFPGHPAKLYQEGRSGGWLVVEGLPDIEEWDDTLTAEWDSFASDVTEDIAYRCQPDTVMEDIESNRWAEFGAQQYNFIDTANGVRCMADWAKAKAAAWEAFVGVANQ